MSTANRILRRMTAAGLLLITVGATVSCTAADRALIGAPQCSDADASPSRVQHDPGQAVLIGSVARSALPPGPIDGWERVISVAHAGTAIAAVHPDGRVSVAGTEQDGILAGLAGPDGGLVEPRTVEGVTGAVSVAAVGSTFLVTHRDGTLTAWGESFIASGGEREDTREQPTPQRVSDVDDVVSVAHGSMSALALRSDGSVRGWGINLTQLLGEPDGTRVRTIRDVPGAVSIANAGGATVVASGAGEVCALGNNVHGLLGVEPLGGQSPRVVRIEGLQRVEQVAGGHNFALARDSAGGVWAWGRNDSGISGEGDAADTAISVPRRVPGLPPLRWIGAADFTAYGIDGDGGLWAWGGRLTQEPYVTNGPRPQRVPLPGPAQYVSGDVVLLEPTG